MTEPNIIVAANSGDVLGESPSWLAREQCLYWIDLRAPALRRLDPASGTVESWAMPDLIGAVVGRRSGGLVLAVRHALLGFDPHDGEFAAIANVEGGPPENRLNDAKCDPTGRILCGSMWDFGLRTTGGLYSVDAAGAVAQLRAGVTVANAIAFAPDGRTLYFTDTRQGAIEQADYDPATGEIGPWRGFAAADAAPGRPDGATVDAGGYLWNARYQGGCLARFAPDGRLDRLVELPVSQPTSCAFGGPDLRTLYVTTARQKLSAEALAAEPLAGALLALDVGVAGLVEPLFAG
ncbi:MAG: SMP-30/gluconolactonase/LRE family protein [Bosea sp.]|uniref:SMP-30/gluconolactonase/LRE family protein n=1 Tax=Bosea sp. (in: a-proteobacteria) TaxID=1871050 RepID=UPI00238B5517|nr:SMP-30/gluconolactonase/LRE family protein [Bosea sp. (in: a-proteobacteria)]MCP4740282.1 SMP-30/gluconolactonase/LRE family protein [Bosea sp. (in: a-proteobacteria)]